MLALISTIPSEMHDCFAVLTRKAGEGSRDTSFHAVLSITVAFHSRSQKTNERNLPPSAYIHPNDILRDFLTAAHAKREQRRSRAGHMGQRADVSRCICMKLTGVWTGLVTVALARLTDK